MKSKTRIVVIGGGITGLAAALEIERRDPQGEFTEVVLLEAGSRIGGVLQTELHGDFAIEHAADMFTTDPPDAINLIRRLGHEGDLLNTVQVKDRAYVASENGIHPIPRGLSLMLPGDSEAVLSSPILSDAGKQRFLAEESVPPGDLSVDESLESFAVRRFGDEVYQRLIQPLASGIYTADPKTLSMKATMDRFLKLEHQHGSLIAAGRAKTAENQDSQQQTSGARYGLFRAPMGGIGQLVDWIADALKRTECRTDHCVESLRRTDDGWQLTIKNQDTESTIDCDAIIMATSAGVSGKLLADLNPTLAKNLSSITAASSAIVVSAFDDSQLGNKFGDRFAGYGIILPTCLGRQAIACSFSSNKFGQRAPAGKTLTRGFIGGALQSELVDLPDGDLIKISINELDQTVGVSGQPEFSKVYRWRNCMPQYTLGHVDRVTQIDSAVAAIDGLELAGNSYHGVGIPACINSGTNAAARLLGGSQNSC